MLTSRDIEELEVLRNGGDRFASAWAISKIRELDAKVDALETELQNRDRRILSLDQENRQLRAMVKG